MLRKKDKSCEQMPYQSIVELYRCLGGIICIILKAPDVHMEGMYIGMTHNKDISFTVASHTPTARDGRLNICCLLFESFLCIISLDPNHVYLAVHCRNQPTYDY